MGWVTVNYSIYRDLQIFFSLIVRGIEYGLDYLLTSWCFSLYSVSITHPPNAGMCLIYLFRVRVILVFISGWLSLPRLSAGWMVVFKPVVRWAPAMAMRDYSPPAQVFSSLLQSSVIFHLRPTAQTTGDMQLRLWCVTSKFTSPCLALISQCRNGCKRARCAVGLATPEAGGLGPTHCCSVPPPQLAPGWADPQSQSQGKPSFGETSNLSPKTQSPVTPSEKQIVSKKSRRRKEERKNG